MVSTLARYVQKEKGYQMIYCAVGDRCAVDLSSLKLPVTKGAALQFLARKGFRVENVNLSELARRRVGVSNYIRGAHPRVAPQTVDCSSFVKWLYGQCGIWLPRRTIQQRQYGKPVMGSENAIPGDLIFTTGTINYYDNDPEDGVGHVGIVTSANTVTHAANSTAGVRETPIDVFVGKAAQGKTKYRGTRRYVPENSEVITFKIPSEYCVETSDDFRWIILQNLSKAK